MPNKTAIGWTDFTSNPIKPVGGGWGCSKVSPGCKHCYAETLNMRFGNKRKFSGSWEFRLDEKEMDGLVKLNAKAGFEGSRPKVFLGDMTDIFHESIPYTMLADLFSLLDSLGNLTIQTLTKRVDRMERFANQVSGDHWPEHIWAGTSVENSNYLWRLDHLAPVPAAVRFVSLEPLLGSVDLAPWLIPVVPAPPPEAMNGSINWVIIGGESGPGFRPMDIAWMESVAADCQAAGVACYIKQASALTPGRQGNIPNSLWALKQFPA